MAKLEIEIYDKKVPFKITGLTPIQYFTMFQSDFLKDFAKLEQSSLTGDYDLNIIYQMIYCLALKADDSIGEMEDWLDSFEDGFPVFEVFYEITPLIQRNFMSEKKAKQHLSKVTKKK